MEKDIKIPTTRNGKQTFKIIVDTAVQVFYEKGYHSTTIKDITEEAGIAIGTFYLYFKNKYVLYRYILKQFQHDIRQAIAEKVASVDGRFEKEKVGIRTFIEFAVEKPHTFNIIWESLYIDKTLFVDYYTDFAKRYEKGLKKSIEDEEMYDVDTELVSYMLMGVTNFIGLKVLLKLGEDKGSAEEVVTKVMDIIKTGIFK